jgi:hypothetical protein
VSISGTYNETNISIELLYDDVFEWNYYACDSAGNCVWGENNWTIEFDGTAPNIEFVPPTPNETFITELFVNISSSDDNDHYTFLDFDDSLVGWWRFEDTNETHTFDESGFENHGTIVGATQTDVGRFGNAMEFDGKSNYLEMPISLSSDDLKNEFSISTWVYPENLVGRIWGSNDANSESNNFRINSVGSLTIKLRSIGSNPEDTSSVGLISQNKWYHTVVTYKDSRAYVYLNGNLIITGTQATHPSIHNGVGDIIIGGRMSPVQDHFNGSIDDVLIFNRALSEDEIKSLYNATANQYQNNFTDLNNDEYTFKGYAVDTAGNKNETETREVFYIDMPPEGYLVYHNFTSPYLLFNGDGVEIESGNRTTNPVLIVKRLYAYDPFLEFTIKGDVNLNPVDVDVLIDTIFTRTVVSGLDQIPNVTGKHSLFVSNMGYGIYICPHAQSINEINLFCPDYATFDCPGTLGNYSCIVLGDFYKVSGLSGSGVAADLPFDWAQIPEFSTLGIVLAVILILLSTFFIRREKGKI